MPLLSKKKKKQSADEHTTGMNLQCIMLRDRSQTHTVSPFVWHSEEESYRDRNNSRICRTDYKAQGGFFCYDETFLIIIVITQLYSFLKTWRTVGLKVNLTICKLYLNLEKNELSVCNCKRLIQSSVWETETK